MEEPCSIIEAKEMLEKDSSLTFIDPDGEITLNINKDRKLYYTFTDGDIKELDIFDMLADEYFYYLD